jgi:hypothetical protein
VSNAYDDLVVHHRARRDAFVLTDALAANTALLKRLLREHYDAVTFVELHRPTASSIIDTQRRLHQFDPVVYRHDAVDRPKRKSEEMLEAGECIAASPEWRGRRKPTRRERKMKKGKASQGHRRRAGRWS